MKEIITTKLVEQTTRVYIANDGTEFTEENLCLDYERRSDWEKVNKDFDNLKIEDIEIPMLNYVAEDASLFLLHLENKKDFVIVKDYLINLSKWMDLSCVEERQPESYPCNIMLFVQGEYADIYNRNFEELKEQSRNLIETIDKYLK